MSLVLTYSIILAAFLMMIRELKPEVFRYPYFIVLMPLIIPVSYYLIYQTSLMRDIIIHSVSGMIVLVSLILSVSYRSSKKPLISIGLGSFLLLTSILLLILLEEDQYFHLLWYLTTSTGIAVTAYGFINTFNENIDI